MRQTVPRSGFFFHIKSAIRHCNISDFLNTSEGCWVNYSDGREEDLKKLLALPDRRDDLLKIRNTSILRTYQFKILEYMYGKGYELLAVDDQRNTDNQQYFFKHK